MHPVRAIDIRMPSRTKHRGIAGRPPAEAVRGWVFTIIGLVSTITPPTPSTSIDAPMRLRATSGAPQAK